MIIKTYNYKGIRFDVALINGSQWFIGKDICNIIDLKDTSDTVSNLSSGVKRKVKIPISGHFREVWIINEIGINEIILRSVKSIPKAIKKWIAYQALPLLPFVGNRIIKVRPQEFPEMQNPELTEQ